MITMGDLQARMKALQEEYTRVQDGLEQANRTLCALDGAIQDVKFWMSQVTPTHQKPKLTLVPSNTDGETQ